MPSNEQTILQPVDATSTGGGEVDASPLATVSVAPKITVATENADLLGDVIKAYAGFDPSIHASDNEGKPRFTADGGYAKKRGRKAGQKTGVQITDGKLTMQDSAPNQSANFKVAALGTVLMITQSMQSLFGPQWKPEKLEIDSLTDSLEQYYASKGIDDLPPGFVLAFAISAYSLPRISHPETLSRWDKIKVALAPAYLKVRALIGR